jgi:hypothetical protein
MGMRKKDPEFNENIDRKAGSNNASPAVDKPEENDAGETGAGEFTKVKNASASGLGTMGRSDEKLGDQSGNTGSNAY